MRRVQDHRLPQTARWSGDEACLRTLVGLRALSQQSLISAAFPSSSQRVCSSGDKAARPSCCVTCLSLSKRCYGALKVARKQDDFHRPRHAIIIRGAGPQPTHARRRRRLASRSPPASAALNLDPCLKGEGCAVDPFEFPVVPLNQRFPIGRRIG